MMATVRERIAERYPSLLSLLAIPEMNRLLTRAVNESWSPGQFQSQFIASNWFKSQSESQRRWWVTAHTDPGEARKQRAIYQRELSARASQLGIKPTSAELNRLREQMLAQGIGVNDYWVTDALLRLANKGGRTTAGAWSTTADQLRQISLNEFLKPLPDQVNKKWTAWIVAGQKTVDDFRQASLREASKRYPHMVEEIKQGMTPGEVIAPMREIIAEELELGDPGRVSMNDPRWRQLTGIRDPKTQKMRMMTESEVLKLARSQNEWWQTSKGRQQDAAMTTAIREMFGLRKM